VVELDQRCSATLQGLWLEVICPAPLNIKAGGCAFVSTQVARALPSKAYYVNHTLLAELFLMSVKSRWAPE